MEFERSDPPSALKSRRPQTVDVERRSSAPSRATSPPPPSAERRHTIENSAALARWTIAHGDTRGPRPLTSPRRASGRFDVDDASDTSSADSEECQAPPRRSWAQAMELTGDIRRPELSPVVEESSPDSDRSTPQPTIPLEDHLGDLLALPPAQQRARPSETVQLEADLGAGEPREDGALPAPPGLRHAVDRLLHATNTGESIATIFHVSLGTMAVHYLTRLKLALEISRHKIPATHAEAPLFADTALRRRRVELRIVAQKVWS